MIACNEEPCVPEPTCLMIFLYNFNEDMKMHSIMCRVEAIAAAFLIAVLMTACGTSGDNGPITERPAEELNRQTPAPAQSVRSNEMKAMSKMDAAREMYVAGGIA